MLKTLDAYEHDSVFVISISISVMQENFQGIPSPKNRKNRKEKGTPPRL
jgi:hypothetical protein